MPAAGRPKRVTLRGRWLGKRLRELRDENGFTLEYVAEFMQRTNGTISRFETGVYPIRRPDVLALLDLYGMNDEKERTSLLKLSESVWQTGWWDGFRDDFAEWFVDFVWLEEQAKEYLLFDAVLLPGMVHTEAYARAAMLAEDPTATREQVDRWIELRQARQTQLDRENPPRMRAVFDESVLRRRVGSTRIMADQLDHLNELARRPEVELRVLPFAAGAHASPSGSFRVMKMDEPYPEVAYVETPKGAVYIESPDTDQIVERYDRIWEKSLTPEESAEFISALIEELS